MFFFRYEKQSEIILQIDIADIQSIEIEEIDINCIENEDFIYKFSIFLEKAKYTFGCKSMTQMQKWIIVLNPQNYNRFNEQISLDDFTIIQKIGSGYSG